MKGIKGFKNLGENQNGVSSAHRVICNKIAAIGQRTMDKKRIRKIWLRNMKLESGRGAIFGEQILEIYHN